jgi:hypothetical protein
MSSVGCGNGEVGVAVGLGVRVGGIGVGVARLGVTACASCVTVGVATVGTGHGSAAGDNAMARAHTTAKAAPRINMDTASSVGNDSGWRAWVAVLDMSETTRWNGQAYIGLTGPGGIVLQVSDL